MKKDEPISYAVWGEEIDESAHAQMRNACSLPVAEGAALMPDAHVGYGLPIGGVLATRDCVIPYAVGVDIACRMMMTVFDLPPERLDKDRERFRNILSRETMFGVGQGWRGRNRPQHDVMDEDWSVTPLTGRLKEQAWDQLGTSGSGNHFVEFGTLEVGVNTHGIAPGNYLAVLSHSGSRGPGAQVCNYYSKVARDMHPELSKELSYLAWLPLDTQEGQEYWAAMNLMGKFASANHHVIHRKIARAVGVDVLTQVENHHNFAWKERHPALGEGELIVHRKGATPAGRGVLGLIPGSMATPGYLVEGLGNARSMDSASHGAGRRLSRTKARETTRWGTLRREMEQLGIEVMSAGADECPQAYKDIESVMAAQSDLVRRIAKFSPRLVRMAPEGEKPED